MLADTPVHALTKGPRGADAPLAMRQAPHGHVRTAVGQTEGGREVLSMVVVKMS